MQYVAYNLQTALTDIDVCRDCTWPPPPVGDDGLANCKAVTDASTRYYIKDHYAVVGVDNMKAALQEGPISCGVHATENFEKNYKSGEIYSEVIGPLAMINHEISVVGYSKDAATGEEYWVGRNSWGNYWGMYGFFYMAMYEDNLRITKDCIAGHV